MNLFYLIVFVIGVVWSITERVRFERNHQGKSEEYIELYRKHNNMMIVIFAALTIDKIILFMDK